MSRRIENKYVFTIDPEKVDLDTIRLNLKAEHGILGLFNYLREKKLI